MWVHRQVQDAVYGGAELLAGGEPLPGRGFFYPPTVLVNAPDDALVNCGETRGPVVSVRVADSFDAALDSGRVGLASVLTPSHANAQRAWRALPARTVSVNAIFAAPPPGAEPELLNAVTRTKVVHLARVDPGNIPGSPRVIPNGRIVLGPAACGPWNRRCLSSTLLAG